jgi:hypothetical protein
VQVVFKSSVPTAKKTAHSSVTKNKFLTQIKEIISVYTESHSKPVSTKCVDIGY